MLALILYCFGFGATLLATEVPTQLASSTYLGSASDHDEVVGVRIAADGTLIVAANVGGKIYEDATRIDLPSFSQPSKAPPRLESFPDRGAFRQAALDWITEQYPSIPPAPSLDEPKLAEVLEKLAEKNAKHHKPLSEEALAKKVLSKAQDAYIQTWLAPWRGGSLLRISADGRRVLSQVRIGLRVADLHLDGAGNVYVAAGPQGIVSFQPDALTLRPDWSLLSDLGADRIHADPKGFVVVLSGGQPGQVSTFNPKAELQFQREGFAYTRDVAISSRHKKVYLTGHRYGRAPQRSEGSWKSAGVEVAYLRALELRDGEESWSNYDWRIELDIDPRKITEETELPDNFLHKFINNSRDTRGSRVTIGDDGELYASFETEGTENIFRFEPNSLQTPIADKLAPGDQWHRFEKPTGAAMGILGRFDPRSGALKRLQQFNTIYLEKRKYPRSSGFSMAKGDIHADAEGRVYLTGEASNGLPILHSSVFGLRHEPPQLNPFSRNISTGGAYLMVLSPDFSERLFTTRLSSEGQGRSVHAREVDGSLRVSWSGATGLKSPSYMIHSAQTSPGWGQRDGFLALLAAPSGANNLPHRVLVHGADLKAVKHHAERSQEGPQSMSLRIPISVIARQGKREIKAAAVSQARNYGKRSVKQPAKFVIDRDAGKVQLSDVQGHNLANEKNAEVRQWMALFTELTEKDAPMGFGQGDFLLFDGEHRLSQLRYLVRNGEQWYVSSHLIKNRDRLQLVIDESDFKWAPLNLEEVFAANDPPADLFNSQHASFTPQNFSNLNAVGVFGLRNWTKANKINTGVSLRLLEAQLTANPVDDPAPVAEVRFNRGIAERFSAVSFSAESSHDHGQDVGFMRWQVGSELSAVGPRVKHAFQAAGRHKVTLTVWDRDGGRSQTTKAIDIALEGMEFDGRIKPIVAHASSSNRRHFSFGGFSEAHGDMLMRPVSLSRHFFPAPGGILFGGGILPADKRPVFDAKRGSIGSEDRALATVSAKIRGTDGRLLLAAKKDQFLAGASKSGADLSEGQLYARGVQCDSMYWVLHGPDGWFISQDPATEEDELAFRDTVSELTWLPFDPSSPEGFLGPASEESTPEATQQVDAVGVVLVIDHEFTFGGLGATGLPLK